MRSSTPIEVDLQSHPSGTSSLIGNEFVIGDSHANVLLVINILLEMGILVTTKENYDAIKELQCSIEEILRSDCKATPGARISEALKMLLSEVYSAFESCLAEIHAGENSKNLERLIFLGDDTADRGSFPGDYGMLLFYEHLEKLKINFIVIFSNHNQLFFDFFKKRLPLIDIDQEEMPFPEEDRAFDLRQEYYISTAFLVDFLNYGAISKTRFSKLFERYRKHIRCSAHSIIETCNGKEMVVYTHAPIGISFEAYDNSLEILAKRIDPDCVKRPTTTIASENSAAEHMRYVKFLLEIIEKKFQAHLYDVNEDRDYWKALQFFVLQRSCAPVSWPFLTVHGHDLCETPLSISLDGETGKPGQLAGIRVCWQIATSSLDLEMVEADSTALTPKPKKTPELKPYHEKYPLLTAALEFSLPHFNLVCETIECYFSDLFSLDSLEECTKQYNAGNTPPTLLFLFLLCTKKTHDELNISTVPEMLGAILSSFYSEGVTTFIHSNLIFASSTDSEPLGLFERIALEKDDKIPPLTILDMRRAALRLSFKRYRDPDPISRQINSNNEHTLHHVFVGKAHALAALKQPFFSTKEYPYALLDVSSTALPKWIAYIDTTSEGGRKNVFCASELTESERATLKKALGENSQYNFVCVSLCAAESADSGYIALAHLYTALWTMGLRDENQVSPFNKKILHLGLARIRAESDFRSLYLGILNLLNPLCNTKEKENENPADFMRELRFIAPAFHNTDQQNRVNPKLHGYFERETDKRLHRAGMATDAQKLLEPTGLSQAAIAFNHDEYKRNLAAIKVSPNYIIPGFYELLLASEHVIEELHGGRSDEILGKQACLTFAVDEAECNEEIKRLKESGKDNIYFQGSVLAATSIENTSIVLAAALLAFVRNNSKKNKFTITLPELDIPENYIDALRVIIAENTKIKEIVLIGENSAPRLRNFIEEIKPQLMRNRWLNQNGYLSSSHANDAWEKATEYFLFSALSQRIFDTKFLTVTSDKNIFAQMGFSLLNATLKFLSNDENQDRLKAAFSSEEGLSFYTAMHSEIDGKSTLALLQEHIHEKKYFPFKKIIVDAPALSLDEIVDFICECANSQNINELRLDSFKNAQLDEYLKFFSKLSELAEEKAWKISIRMPSIIDSDNESIISAYRKLNATIAKNAPKDWGFIQAIIDSLQPKPSPGENENISSLQEKPPEEDDFNKLGFDEEEKYPLAHTVELQHVQESTTSTDTNTTTDTNISVQASYQKSNTPKLDRVIGKLVNRDSIDATLSYWFKLQREENIRLNQFISEVVEKYFEEGFDTNLLQHLWDRLSDTPKENLSAGTVVRDTLLFISIDAIKRLLLNIHIFYVSGINLDNLPSGYYIQTLPSIDFDVRRNDQEGLLIGYDESERWHFRPNRFTVRLDAESPDEKHTAREAFNFYKPILSALPDELQSFLVGDKKNLVLPNHELRRLYQLIETHHGDKTALNYFVKILHIIQSRLGDDFLFTLRKTLLWKSGDYNIFITNNTFYTFNEIINRFSDLKNEGEKKLFSRMLTLHFEAVGFEELTMLWDAFLIFIGVLESHEISISGDEFDGIKATNMLITLERLVRIVDVISIEEKAFFIKSLANFDLGHCGVYYAATVDEIKFIRDPALCLTHFENGSPGYLPPTLETIFNWDNKNFEKLRLTIYRLIACHLPNDYFNIKNYFSNSIDALEANYSNRKVFFGNEFQGILNRFIFFLYATESGYSTSESISFLQKLYSHNLGAAMLRFFTRGIYFASHVEGRTAIRFEIDAILKQYQMIINMEENIAENMQVLLPEKNQQRMEKTYTFYSVLSVLFLRINAAKTPQDFISYLKIVKRLFQETEIPINPKHALVVNYAVTDSVSA